MELFADPPHFRTIVTDFLIQIITSIYGAASLLYLHLTLLLIPYLLITSEGDLIDSLRFTDLLYGPIMMTLGRAKPLRYLTIYVIKSHAVLGLAYLLITGHLAWPILIMLLISSLEIIFFFAGIYLYMLGLSNGQQERAANIDMPPRRVDLEAELMREMMRGPPPPEAPAVPPAVVPEEAAAAPEAPVPEVPLPAAEAPAIPVEIPAAVTEPETLIVPVPDEITDVPATIENNEIPDSHL